MNKWMWISIAVMFVAFMYFASQEDMAFNKNYTDCVSAMQKAIPDANDNSRASFLKDCQK